MRNILISGIDGFLASHFAAQCLRVSPDRVFYLPGAKDGFSEKEIEDLVFHAADQLAPGKAEASQHREMSGRLRRTAWNADTQSPGNLADTRVDEVWYFANGRANRAQASTLEALISVARKLGAKEFNYVGAENASGGPEPERTPSAPGVAKASERIPDKEVSQLCEPQGIGWRIFHTSLLLGQEHPRLKQVGAVLPHFLSVLYSFKAEIEERSPQYFDFQALRFFAPKDAALNLIPARLASELLLHIARTPETAGSSYSLLNPENTPFPDLCERIGTAFGLGLLPVEDFGCLNAIDRAFHERLGSHASCPMRRAPKSPGTQAYQAAKLSPDRARLDEEAQIALFESSRQMRDEARAAYKQRVAELPGRLAKKTISRDGAELSYYAGGAGEAVVILNALGQGLEYWQRLIDELMKSYRVILWEPRGTVSPPPPFGLVDQVDDADAVLRNEGIDTCHLVGWCTGPKVAMGYYLKHSSSVRSMVFLNGTFKCDGSPEELDSPYEQNLESLCRMLARKPAMAGSVMKTFQSPPQTDETAMLEGQDSEAMSVAVLSMINAGLKSRVLAPFKTEETTLNYAHQLIDFWSHDSRSQAGEVRIPVLLMSAEYDQVATPANSQAAAALFPNARHVHVAAATHYCLYDRPDFVAGLLKTFFERPDDLPAAQPVPDTVAAEAQ